MHICVFIYGASIHDVIHSVPISIINRINHIWTLTLELYNRVPEYIRFYCPDNSFLKHGLSLFKSLYAIQYIGTYIYMNAHIQTEFCIYLHIYMYNMYIYQIQFSKNPIKLYRTYIWYIQMKTKSPNILPKRKAIRGN